MTEFYVDPTAITRFATATGNDGLAGDADRGVTYHSTYCTIPSDATGVVFQNFSGIAAECRAGVGEALTHLRTLLRTSSTELAATAAYYRDTDTVTAAQLDGTY